MQDSITPPRGLALPKGAPMMLWTPCESDRNTRADERYEDFTPLSKPSRDPIAAFWASLGASRVRVAFDARNAREVA